MPRRVSSSDSPKVLKQQNLLGFFQQGSGRAPPSGSRSSEGEGSRTVPAKRSRQSHKEHGETPRGSRKAARLEYSGSEQPDQDAGSESSDVAAIGFEETEASADSVVEEDDLVLSPKKPPASPRKVRRMRADSIEALSITEESDGEPEVIGVPVFRKKGNAVAKPRRNTIVSSSDEDRPHSKKRKLVKGVRPPTPEEDLLDEVDSDSEH